MPTKLSVGSAISGAPAATHQNQRTAHPQPTTSARQNHNEPRGRPFVLPIPFPLDTHLTEDFDTAPVLEQEKIHEN